MVLLQGLKQPLRRSKIRDSCLHGDARTYPENHGKRCARLSVCACRKGEVLVLTAHDSDASGLKNGLNDPLDMTCWVGRGHKKRRRRRKGGGRIQREERRHRTEDERRRRGQRRDARGSGGGRTSWRKEGGLEELGPVRFRAGDLTRWRAGRVGSALGLAPSGYRPYNARLTLLYLTPTPTYSHFYFPFYYRGHIHTPLRMPICLCRHCMPLLLPHDAIMRPLISLPDVHHAVQCTLE